MATLDLHIPQPSVTRNVTFAGHVDVVAARPGATIQVSLRQVQGTGAFTAGAVVKADHLGNGLATFPNIALPGIPGGREIATLLVDASDDAGDFFWASSKSVEVI